MMNVVILTGNELRHQFFVKKVALYPGIRVLKSYCETQQNLLLHTAKNEMADLRRQHLEARLQSEKDFFELYVQQAPDKSNTLVIERGSINEPAYIKEIANLQPDVIMVYGASIIKQPLLSLFPEKIVNVHLGLSPYYRGAATNFWPLVQGLPECVGATFMFIDAGIDTGQIIYQVRPTLNYFDTPAAIGNRLIKQMTDVYCQLVTQFHQLQPANTNRPVVKGRYCKKSDYTELSVQQLYNHFNNGMIYKYLSGKTTRDADFPLVNNPMFSYDKSHHVPLRTEV